MGINFCHNTQKKKKKRKKEAQTPIMIWYWIHSIERIQKQIHGSPQQSIKQPAGYFVTVFFDDDDDGVSIIMEINEKGEILCNLFHVQLDHVTLIYSSLQA